MRYTFNPDDAIRFASERGIKTVKRYHELLFRKCPYCRQMTDDTNTFSINLETGQFKCFRASCDAHGNMITLARDFDFSLGTDIDEYYSPKRQFRNLRKYPRPVTKDAAVAYLENRGISRNIAEAYRITIKEDQENVIVFPFYDEHDELQFVKYRKADFDKEKDSNKEWCMRNCKPILFGMNQCNAERSPVLVLTEGQIDSLSVAEAFNDDINAVSVPTGANGFTWVPYCWDFLKRFNTLVVFGDHEHGKITLLEEMTQRFHGTVKYVRPEDYKECKDANEILQKHGKQAVVDAVVNAEVVKNDLILDLSDAPRKSTVEEVIDTGIAQLNRMIGGFPTGRVIALTGQSGKGKSTLATQFAIRAAEQGFKTFVYSGELSSWEVARTIDRQVAGADYLVRTETPLGFVEYDPVASQRDNIVGWAKGKVFLYNNEIVMDGQREETALIDVMQDSVRQYGCKVIILDNLMTAMMDDISSDLYRQQTKFVEELHNAAVAWKVLIILIAHQRKRQANEFSNDDIAGSSNITNLADIILNYAEPAPNMKYNKDKKKYEPADPDPDRDGDRILQVTKNRITGQTDLKGIKLWFQPSSMRISEYRNRFDWQMSWQSGTNGFMQTDENDLDEIPF